MLHMYRLCIRHRDIHSDIKKCNEYKFGAGGKNRSYFKIVKPRILYNTIERKTFCLRRKRARTKRLGT